MLAREWGESGDSKKNWKVNACSPGAIATDFFDAAKPKFCCKCLLQKILWSPDRGTGSAMKLLFGEVGSGKFYHKSGEERALDKY